MALSPARPHLARTSFGRSMGKVLAFIGATFGGALGWWLGDRVGLMTAFLLSMVGTGAGMYAGVRFARQYLP